MRDCILEFQAFCYTSYGEQLRISGNTIELGNWHQQKSLILSTNKEIYPIWRCSKKIRVRRNMTIQFKVWIEQDGKLKRWQNYPNCQNRLYTSHLRKVTLVIMVDQPGLTSIRKTEHQESQQFIVADPVRKFNENNLKDDEARSSSSFDYFDNFKIFQDFNPKPSFNLDYIARAYKQIISRFQISETKIKQTQIQGRVANIARKIIHVSQIKELNMIENKNIFPINLAIDELFGQNSIKIASEVIPKMTVGQCFIFHEIQLCFVVKLIRKNLNNNNNYKLGMFISNLNSLQNILIYLQKKDIIECLILTNVLLFPSFQTMNQILDLIQSFGIDINLQFHSFGTYTLNIYDRPILFKVISPQQEYTISTLQFLSIHPQSVIKKRIQNIKFTEQEHQYSKVIIFSFGIYQNFNIIKNNKDIINLLCQTHQIFVFTPNRLSEYQQAISLFPKVLFISYTYLEMEYMKIKKNIDNLNVFSDNFKRDISCAVSKYPKCEFEISNNHIFVKNTDTSYLGNNRFQQLICQIQDIVNSANRSLSPQQNKSLTLTRTNKSRAMIRQIFQTQLFFTKVILQTIESRIDFILLFIFNRFQNFRFLEELKLLASQKSFNASVMAYTLGYVKNRHCYNIMSNQFTQILSHLEKSIQKPKKNKKTKKISIGYWN